MILSINRKAQSTLEYVVLVAVIVAGLVTMQHYVKRGVQGKFKSSADDLGEQFDPEGYTESYNYDSSYDQTETVEVGGITTTDLNDSTSTKTNYKSALEDLSTDKW